MSRFTPVVRSSLAACRRAPAFQARFFASGMQSKHICLNLSLCVSANPLSQPLRMFPSHSPYVYDINKLSKPNSQTSPLTPPLPVRVQPW